ncbi:MAG TPA: GntR family transcriptional regulator [Steroidobacteraceae bacterium]|jgi:GntR family transcriptional regulator|nr:GntR family transcriptional regulator [Steroidobacteraceae bacterium]
MHENSAHGASRSKPLDMHIETDSYVPYYQQVVDQVRALISSEVLREGDIFHSEGEIAAALNISKMPVRQAFMKLRSEGLLIIEKGKRPVVGSSQMPWNFQQLRGFTEEMRRRGLNPSAKVLHLKRAGADAETAQALRLAAGDPIFSLRRLRYVNGQPVALVTSYVPATIFPDLDQQDLERQSLYFVFEKIYRRKLSWADEEIGATTATAAQARVLDTSPGKPLLSIRETTFDTRGTAVEHSHSLLRADRYKATVVSVRKR